MYISGSTMRPPLEIILQILLKLSLLRTVVTSGCSLSSALGMESGIIQDNQLSAFSSHPRFGPENARLNNNSEWRADANNQSQWLQVDLRKTTVLTGIQTQGQRTGRDRFVTSFEVSYSDDGADWTVFTGNSDQNQLLEGNSDKDSIRENTFIPPIIARYIRVHPRSWYICGTPRCIAMRIELLGCEFTTTTIPTTVSTTSTIKTTSQPVVSTTSDARTTHSPLASTSTPRKTPDQALVTTTVIVNTTRGNDGNMDMLQDSEFPTELAIGASVAGVVVILAIAVAVAFVIRRRGGNGSQKEPTNEEGEGTVENIIYDSAAFSANENDGGVSFGQSDGFVDNNLYAGIGESPTTKVQWNQTSQKNDQNALYAHVNKSQDKDGFVDNDLYAGIGESPTTEVQKQTSQKNDQTPLYANVNKSQDEGFVDNDLYASMDTQNRDC